MKKYIILISEILIVAGLTILIRPVVSISNVWLRIVLAAIIDLAIGLSGFIACKLSGIEIDFKWKCWKQYLIGLGICLVLSFFIAWLPALLGYSLVGSHINFSWIDFAYNLFDYILIIGPIEEMVFRVYFQNAFISIFKGKKCVGILVASALFGIWHYINGNLIQVLFTFGIGCVFGFSKEYIKDLHYPGIALCHGFYDFLIYVVCFAIV